MQLRRFDHVEEFWQQAQCYLLQHEAEHNALLGMVQRLLDYPEHYFEPHLEPPYLAIVHTNDTVLALAIRTPPNNLLLSKAQNLSALQLIAHDLQAECLPGVTGLVAEVEAFVQAYHALTGELYQREVDMKLYQLTQVKPVNRVSGYLRLATQSDRPLLLQWFAAFDAEVGWKAEDVERKVDIRLKQQSVYLWEDGIPVSMAGGKQFSSTAGRIAPVYTPPEYRGKGYATAGVAALSQHLLDQGCDRCFLFTDLANPTSNYIYQQIGYYPIADWCEYSLISKA